MAGDDSETSAADGRAPDADKVFARRVVETPEAKEHIEGVLNGTVKPDKVRLDYYRYMCDRAYGRPAQPIEGGDERKPLAIRIIPWEKPVE